MSNPTRSNDDPALQAENSTPSWGWLHSRPIRVGNNGFQYREPEIAGPRAGIVYFRDTDDWARTGSREWRKCTVEEEDGDAGIGGPLEPFEPGDMGPDVYIDENGCFAHR